MKIRESTPEELALIAMLVSESNKDVAIKFGLNAENCPKHPSFYTADWVTHHSTGPAQKAAPVINPLAL